MQGTTTLGFDYGAEHQRIKQTAPDGTTLYIAGLGAYVEKHIGASITTWREYLIACGEMIGVHHTRSDATQDTRYFLKDHLGSIAVITDEAGNVVERLAYDPWGKRRFPDGSDDPTGSITSLTTRGFTGHEMLDSVDLVHMNARIYDPALGRFMTPDPLVADAFNLQSVNAYSYVENRPLSATDPTGTITKVIVLGIRTIPTAGPLFAGSGLSGGWANEAQTAQASVTERVTVTAPRKSTGDSPARMISPGHWEGVMESGPLKGRRYTARIVTDEYGTGKTSGKGGIGTGAGVIGSGNGARGSGGSEGDGSGSGSGSGSQSGTGTNGTGTTRIGRTGSAGLGTGPGGNNGGPGGDEGGDFWSCLAQCALDQFGISDAWWDLNGLETPLELLGFPFLNKALLPDPGTGKIGLPGVRGRFWGPRASNWTNLISAFGFYYDYYSKVGEPKLPRQMKVWPWDLRGSTRVFGIAGRFLAPVAIGLTAYDLTMTGLCTYRCVNQ